MSQSSADYVIVGAGIYGVATAWELARRGAEVLVLEANTVASGASGGWGKRGVRANGRDLRELPLMALAYERWPNLATELGAATGYVRTGMLRLYERHQDVGAAEVRARIQTELGVPTEHVSAQTARALEAGLSERVLGALYCPLDGVADHNATTQAYAAAAVREGAVIQDRTRVTKLETARGRCRAVRLEDGSEVRVGRELFLAANAGVPDLLEPALGRKMPVWTVYPQVVLSTPTHSPPVRHLIGHAHRPLAVKMMDSGQVMLSGGWRGRFNPELGRSETVPRLVTGNWNEATAVFPAIAELQVAEATADRAETVCVDDIPILDRAPGLANVLVATGWSGHGWALAPAVTPLLAYWTLKAATPELLRPFSFSRFNVS